MKSKVLSYFSVLSVFVLVSILSNCNIEQSIDKNENTVIPEITKMVMPGFQNIAGGEFHSLALSFCGELYVTGNNNHGQLGTGNTTDLNTWTPTGIRGVTAIACGRFHSMIVRDGYLYVAGFNSYGALGLGNTTDQLSWVKTNFNKIQKIACGSNHSMFTAYDENNTIYLWVTGYNDWGQLGLGNTETQYSWKKTKYGNIENLACGFGHSMFTSGGYLWVTGFNGYGELGLGDTYNRHDWTPTSYGNIQNIACGLSHSMFIAYDSTNTIYLWVTGENNYGQLGIGSTGNINTWTKTIYGNIENIACGYFQSLFTSGRQLWITGSDWSGELGLGNIAYITNWTPTVYGDISNLACGAAHSMFISRGYIWATGNNYCGQLGFGNNNDISEFTQNPLFPH